MKLGPINISLAEKSKKPQVVEIGATGTIILSGQLCETEYNTELQGIKGLTIYDKMRMSDGQVKGVLLACSLPIRVASWDITPASDDPIDIEIAQFVKDNLFDQMTITWDDFLRHVLLMFPFGFSIFEKVWELVDGMYRYRKLAPRLAKTITKWETDPTGGLKQVEQTVYKDEMYQTLYIPVEKLLLFSLDKEGSNFAGTSLLRAAYKHWYYKDVLYRIDGIAAERHGVGIAVFTLADGATTEGTDSDQAKIDKIGSTLHTHERSYIALPNGFSFDLKGASGQLHDTMKSIEHHDVQIARSILLQFMNLGAQGVGSYAQSVDQSSFFLMSLQAVCKFIEDTMNRYAIPPLVDYNWDVKRYPKLKASGMERRDLATYSRAVSDLIYAGALKASPGLEDELNSLLKLPRKTATVAQSPPDKEQQLSDPKGLSLGGEGSGYFDHAGRPGEVGGSSSEGTGSDKSSRAKASHLPATREVQKAARASQSRLVGILHNAKETKDNEPFDCVVGNPPTDVVEVKTIVRAGNDKITMHPESLRRKQESAGGARVHTVVYDNRSGQIYYANRLGSMRLSAMQKVDEGELSRLIGGER